MQTINENQSFNQSIYTGNLDLSTLDIKLLNDEGDILESEELNLKMLIKCFIIFVIKSIKRYILEM